MYKIIITFSCLLFFFLLTEGCSYSRYVFTKDEEERISIFTNRLSSDAAGVDSLQRQILKDGLSDICEYLFQKDETLFGKLDNDVTKIEDAALISSNIYDVDFLKLASDFYHWSDRRTSQKYIAKYDSITQFVSFTTPHFLIYHFSELSEKDLNYIVAEIEMVYDTLITIFNPDSAGISNFERLAMYKSWEEGKFNQSSGELQLTDSRIVLVITETQEQLLSFISNADPATGGITNFSFVPSIPDSIPVWITCQIMLNYSSPLSLIPLTHEITHAITMISYSRPWLVDSVLTASDTKSVSSLSMNQLRPSIIRIEGLIAEGAGYWSNWNIGTFANVHLLPTSREIIQVSEIELLPLKSLITGEIDLSFWDIVRSVFGYVPRDKITQFFISSASFMEFIIPRSTPEQLKKLFTGSSEDLKPEDLELIFEKPISQLEEEWRDYVFENQKLSSQ